MPDNKGWIGVDLDGTLAHYTHWVSSTVIGEPIAPMVARVKRWLDDGKDVRIFTARAGNASDFNANQGEVLVAISDWCLKHLGARLPITNVKDYLMIELWDDRAVQIIPNTGLTVLEHAGKTEGP